MKIRAKPHQALLLILAPISSNNNPKTANKSAFFLKIEISPYLPK